MGSQMKKLNKHVQQTPQARGGIALYSRRDVDAAGQKGYNIGLDVGFAWQGIKECEQQLIMLIMNIVSMVLVTEKLPYFTKLAEDDHISPTTWQADRLRAVLTIGKPDQHYNNILVNAVYNLKQAVDAGLPVLNQIVYEEHPFSQDSYDWLVKFAMSLANAIAALKDEYNPDRDASQIKECLTEYGAIGTNEALELMRSRSIGTIGRKQGPDPITEYVLRETLIAKTNHRQKTKGAQMEWMVNALREHPAVLLWERESAKIAPTAIKDELEKRPIQVQVFNAYRRMDRVQLGEALNQMHKNHPDKKV